MIVASPERTGDVFGVFSLQMTACVIAKAPPQSESCAPRGNKHRQAT